MSKTKKVRKGAGMVLLFLAGILLLALIWLTIREYRPEAEETLAVPSGTETPAPGSSLEILTFNTGYAGLDKTQDFFMDGGFRCSRTAGRRWRRICRGSPGS